MAKNEVDTLSSSNAFFLNDFSRCFQGKIPNFQRHLGITKMKWALRLQEMFLFQTRFNAFSRSNSHFSETFL